MSLLIIFFYSSFLISQTNHLYFAGGVRISPDDPANFDTVEENVNSFLEKNQNWKEVISLRNNFSVKQFEKDIDKFIADINTGQIKEKDQLLIYLTGHGAPAIDGESTHSILASNNDFAGLDKLQSLVSLSESKGIKLAIVDSTCFSGNSLKLKNDKTCLISSTGEKEYGNLNWGEYFTSQLKKGRNLEEVFLDTLKEQHGYYSPRISTFQGRKIHEDLLELVSRYQLVKYENELLAKPFESYFLKNNSEQQCLILENQDVELFEFLNNIESVIGEDIKESLNGLNQAILAYKKFQQEILNDLKSITTQKLPDFNGKVEHMVYINGVGHNIIYKDVDILAISDEELENIKKKYSPWGIGLVEKINKRRLELSQYKKSHDLVKNYFKNNQKLIEASSKLALEVNDYLRMVYLKLYEWESLKLNNMNNPCKAFKL